MPPESALPNTARPEQGFTLLEVLIAMLILALGAGGIITMHLQALRLTQDSGYQASAVQFAAELAERMATDDADAYLFSATPNTDGNVITSNFPDCHHHACDPHSMAQYTVGDWLQRLRRALPQARATVCRDQVADSQHWDCHHGSNASVVIKIGWTARSAVNTSDGPSLVLVTGW